MLRPQPELVDQPVPKARRVNDSKAMSQGTDADCGFKEAVRGMGNANVSNAFGWSTDGQ